MQRHLMIDLETLDTKPSAVVTQIGLVLFNKEEILERKNLHIDIEMQLGLGRTISGKTINWWLKQDQAARAIFIAGQQEALTDPDYIKRELYEFITADDDQHLESKMIWGHGATFDVTILDSFCLSIGFERAPWNPFSVRDTRTADMMTRGKAVRPDPVNAHIAVDDAVAQARWVQNMLRFLGETNND